MAIYGIKYQIKYLRKSGGQTTIDILEKNYSEDSSGGITALKAAGDPLTISFDGDINNIYKPTIGSGATIKVMATPLSLRDLFTTDPQKYMVKIYNGNSENSSGVDNLVWQGFVNTGIYTESYSIPISLMSPITIYCNDGINILEDIPYSQTVGGLKYTGFTTIGTVMSNIFSKLSIEFYNIRTATDLKYETHTNLFTALSVNNENYYDEKEEPMSCREVLESIFGGAGLVLSLKGTVIYIIDPIHLHSSYSASKSYDTYPIYGSGEAVIGFGGYLDISARDINWYETGQVSDIIQPFNYIETTYDPYNFTQLGYSFDEEGNAGNTGTYGEYTDNGITYRVHTGITMKDWVISGTPYFEGFEEVSPSVQDVSYVIRQTVGGTGTFTYTFPLSNIQQDDGLMLELSMDVFVNTKHVSNIFDPAEAGRDISSLYLENIQLKIGDKWYKQTGFGTGVWSDTIGYCKPYVRELDAKIYDSYYVHGTWFRKAKYYMAEDGSIISNKWITSVLHIPLAEAYASGVDLVNGSVSIIIPKKLDASVVTGILNVLIKNINIQIVNTKKKPITNDGSLSTASIDAAINMKKSKLDVRLTNGIGPYGVSRGAFSSNEATIAGLNITGLSRVDNVVYKTNQLLLQSLMGQYGSPRFTLNGKLNLVDYINDYTFFSEILFHLIKDSNYSLAVAYYIVSGTYHDREEYMDVEMLELTTIREVIS